MKKIVSILLTLVVLMSSMGLTGFAANAVQGEVDSGLVFNLDFSRYESEGILNDTAGNAPLSFVGDKDVTPSVNSYRGLTEENPASYITFAPDATSFNGDNGGRAIRAEIDEKILGQEELSFEFWVRSSEFEGRWDRIFAIGGDDAGGVRLDVELNYPSKAQFRIGLGKENGSETTIPYNQKLCNGEWQHIVMSRKYDNGTLAAAVYVNGEQIGTHTVENAADPKDWETDKWEAEQIYKVDMTIGGMPGGYGVFRGDMATFRVYNRVLTENEISDNYESGKAMLTPLVVSNMDLSDYDGTVDSIKDNGTNGNGSTFYQSECVQKGTYINLKGEDVPFMDMVQQDSNRGRASVYNNIYGDLEDYTIGAWVRIPDYTKRDWGTIIAHTDKNHYDTKIFGTELSGNTFKLQSKDIISTNSTSIEPYIDTWAHFVFTKEWTKDTNNADVLTLKAYVNGIELTDAAVSGVVLDKSGYMGQTAFGLGSFFKGTNEGGTLIDFSSFTVYNKAFSAAEVAAEYASMREDYTELGEIINPPSESVLVLELPEGVKVNPQTVCRDSFRVSETESGEEISLTDVIFYPGVSGKVKLFAEGTLDWQKNYQVEATGILDEQGSEVLLTEIVSPRLELESELESIFVQELIKTKTEKGGLKISITLTNSGQISYNNLACYLALYKYNRMILIEGTEISLTSEQSETVSFEEIPVSISEWGRAKIIVLSDAQSLKPIKNSGYEMGKN